MFNKQNKSLPIKGINIISIKSYENIAVTLFIFKWVKNTRATPPQLPNSSAYARPFAFAKTRDAIICWTYVQQVHFPNST